MDLAGIICIIQIFINPLKVITIPLVIILVGVLPLVYSLMLHYKMGGKNEKHIIIGSIICLATLLIFLAFWGQLPAEVPIHFDSSGNVTLHYQKRLWYLVFL